MINNAIKNYIINEFSISTDNGFSLSEISGGLSGAGVYLLQIKDSHNISNIGTYVLKVVDTRDKWYVADNNEAAKSKDLFNKVPQFQGKLAKVLKDCVVEDSLVIIQEFALGSRLRTASFAQLDLDRRLELVETVSYELLVSLNDDKIEPTENCDMVNSLCKYRLNDDGNFYQRIHKYLRDPERQAMNILDVVLPNPAYYIPRLNNILESREYRYLLGYVHGDLHQNNIMIKDGGVSAGKDGTAYAIIDYGNWEKNFQLFDQAYLELSMLYAECANWDVTKWAKGLKYAFCIGNQVDETIEYGCISAICSHVWSGVDKWLKDKMPNNRDNVSVQMQLARISAGINYFSKGMIEEENDHIRYLLYIGYGLKELFSLLNYRWEEHTTTSLTSSGENSDMDAEVLWDEIDYNRSRFYIKVLITDDNYTDRQYNKLLKLAQMDWDLIVDVGSKSTGNDLISSLKSEISKYRGVQEITHSESGYSPAKNSTAILRLKLGTGMSGFEHLIYLEKGFIPIFKALSNDKVLMPAVFVVDIHKSKIIRDRLIEKMVENNLIKKGSRFICLGFCLENQDFCDYLNKQKIKYYGHEKLDLINLATMTKTHLLNRLNRKENVYLPCREDLDGYIQEELFRYYNSYVEVIYPGMQYGLDKYNDGREFYCGDEITWAQLSWNRDVLWGIYESQWKKKITDVLEHEKTAEFKLLHAPGAGGTTLSKRIMWDLKDQYPTVRIGKYNTEVANVIIDIYRKTGKTVLAVVEMGSVSVSEEELSLIRRAVDASSCKAVFLRVERSKDGKEAGDNFIYLKEHLVNGDAELFYKAYSSMTVDENRQQYLEKITYQRYSDEWSDQCSPFFYGFYTFQEEYRGLDNFLHVILDGCSVKLKNLLADMAIMTKYSQNITMPYSEMAIRMGLEDYTIMALFKELGDTAERAIVKRETGCRICHPLIAEKMLDMIYGTYSTQESRLLHAVLEFINRINEIYSDDTGMDYVDSMFKELFIDRSYIDGEQQDFAQLIDDLKIQTYKFQIFEKLIELYPSNPHYCNHMGRLETADSENPQFDKAISYLLKALKIAKENNLSLLSHYTTLGSIYSKKVSYDLDKQNQSADRLLDFIEVDFQNACMQFEKARGIDPTSSYAYYPNIQLICKTVKQISKVTGTRIRKLLDIPRFSDWYSRYSGIAMQLYEDMLYNCDTERVKSIADDAECLIRDLKCQVEHMKNMLMTADKKGNAQKANNLRRTISMALYRENNYSWNGMNNADVRFAADQLEVLILNSECNQTDVRNWFQAYCQVENFDTEKAKRFILDFMEDSYNKSYILWLLNFVDYQNDLVPYAQVKKYMDECKNSSQTANLKTSRILDIYTENQNKFPIKRINSVQNDEKELKKFYGHIMSIEGTKSGILQMDANDEILVTFTPSYKDKVDGKKIEFTREDVVRNVRVEFYLGFSLSGYRTWNMRKVE